MKQEAIKQNLQQSVLFKDIGPEQLAEITDNTAIRHVPQGDFVHRKGDQADTFYAVEDRTPRVYPWMNEPGDGILVG
jgi:hypothetical protein